MDVADDLVALIGNTPMVRLDRTARDVDCHLLAKLELYNPGFSSKDRPALAMIETAERDGRLQPGGTIVEPTSGNTGVGLAIVAARRGYKCIFVCPDKVASDKIAQLRAYGAEVIVCPTSVDPGHPDSYYSVSDRLAREVPGAWKPDQYHNPDNPRAQYETTGPEIWEQTKGRVTHFVCGVGTGGTITGIGRYLKEQNPAIRTIGADPEGLRVLRRARAARTWWRASARTSGPATYDPSVVDEVIAISDATSFATARRVTREEGLLIGGSGGTAIAAALQVAAGLPPDAVVVVHIPDSGRGYLSKLYDDGWMADHGFLRTAGPTIGDLLRRARRRPSHPRAHSPRRDGPAGHRDPARVRGEPDAGGEARTPGGAGGGGGSGVGAGAAAGCHRRPRRPRPPGGRGDGPAVAHHRDRRAHRPRRHPPRAGLGGAGARRRSSGRRDHPIGRPRAAGSRSGRSLMVDLDRKGFATRAVHGAGPPDPATGAVVPPVSLATTFRQEAVGKPLRYEYSRSGNPTRTAVEAHLAALEGAAHGLAFASGLAAEDALLRLLQPGDHALLPDDAYGGTIRLAQQVHAPAGLAVDVADLTDLGSVSEAWRETTRLVWIETPSNPWLRIVDIEAVASFARARGALTVVDNTFATPALQQPLALGADVVVHSATKYLGGHSDVVGGLVATSDDDLAERIAFLQNAVGAVPGPLDCYLVHRGMRTLHLRMARHSESAAVVADRLASHPGVAAVLYPGRADHPGHAVAARQMSGFGGMLSVRLAGGEAAALELCRRTEVFTLAESLGAVESLIEHPARMTHTSVAGTANAVPDDLVRLSVGIEDVDDLIADLLHALG